METCRETIEKMAKQSDMSVLEWQAHCKKVASRIPNTANDQIRAHIKAGTYPYYYPFPMEMIDDKSVKGWYDHHKLVLPTKKKEGLIKKG